MRGREVRNTILAMAHLVSTPIGHVIAILDAAYDRKSWHGTNLRGSIRGLRMEQAAWRPPLAVTISGSSWLTCGLLEVHRATSLERQ